MHESLRSKSSAFLLAAVGGISFCHAQASDHIDWRVGDEWVFQRTDLWNGNTFRSTLRVIEETTDGYIAVIPGWSVFHWGSIGEEHPQEFMKDGRMPIRDRSGHHHEPYRLLSLPLAVGRKWETRELWWGGVDNNGQTNWACQVTDREQVATKAGSFDTFRVECLGTYTKYYGGGTQLQTMWYSPGARWFVKAKYVDRFGGKLWSQEEVELVQMHRQDPPSAVPLR